METESHSYRHTDLKEIVIYIIRPFKIRWKMDAVLTKLVLLKIITIHSQEKIILHQVNNYH